MSKLAQVEYCRIYGSAAVIEIGNRMLNGDTFYDAKSFVSKEIMKYQSVDAETRNCLRNLLNSIQPVDLSREVKTYLRESTLADIEKFRGKKAGWIERLFYRLTGYVFWA